MSAPAARRRSHAFDPAAHERELVAILGEIARDPGLDARALDRCLRRHPKEGRGFFSRSELIAGLRHLAPRLELDEAALVERLRLRPVRTLSGVTPVTVLTRPHPCPGRCVFCPSDVRMPKSYLSDEPGAQRAEDNGFDPYLQTWNRLAAYRAIGHPVDKVELIVLGGTWSSHSEAYQRGFAARCLEAMNDFGSGRDRRAARRAPHAALAALRERHVDGRDGPGGRHGPDGAGAYNRIVRRALAGVPEEGAGWEALERAQRANETAAVRCVGLVVETRPDHVTPEEVVRLRRLGATKVQIGLQSLSDRVLAANGRGHDVAASRRALALLRAAGFKLHAHWMANLLGATPEGDVADFARLFDDRDFRPDELKLYPCSLVESAELMAHFERGEWRPYGEAELTRVVAECLVRVPPWCRVTRVIRDFSAGDIVAGSRTANLREVAERRLRAQGRACRDVRAREVRGARVAAGDLTLGELAYATSIGEERFVQLTTADDRLAGFLRLSLPSGAGASCAPDELAGAAVIRELHVYGASLRLGARSAGAAQHVGLGRALLEAACERAHRAGFARVAVISAVGTRDYYRRHGFTDGALYQHRALR